MKITMKEAKKMVVLTRDGEVKVCGQVVGSWRKENPRKERNDIRLVTVLYRAFTAKQTALAATPHTQYTMKELREDIAQTYAGRITTEALRKATTCPTCGGQLHHCEDAAFCEDCGDIYRYNR